MYWLEEIDKYRTACALKSYNDYLKYNEEKKENEMVTDTQVAEAANTPVLADEYTIPEFLAVKLDKEGNPVEAPFIQDEADIGGTPIQDGCAVEVKDTPTLN